jgi:signal transduction histidine kinase
METTVAAASAEPSLAQFVRSHKTEVLDAWKAQVRERPHARAASEADLVGHVPDLLDSIGTLADEVESGDVRENDIPESAEHARQRIAAGFSLADVVEEYRILREAIVTLWERAQRTQPMQRRASTLPIHRAIDHAVAATVSHYVELRERTLKALDDVSSTALASSSLDELLSRLLEVIMGHMPAVQTAVILLREHDRLWPRAAVGLEEELVGDFSLAIGEGFAGTVAKSKKPVLIHSAASDLLVRNPVIHAKGLKALYGVPLLHETKGVLGVAHMGSLTAHDFSREDKDLFYSMVSTAALAVEYHLAKRAADEAAHLATRAAKEAADSRDEILEVVAHDLRNPVSTVMTGVELAKRGLPPQRNERAERAIEMIQRSTMRMTRLIDDLLDFGSIDAHQLKLSCKPESVGSILAEVVDSYRAVVAEHGLRFDCSAEEDLRVECDRERIFQVFGNLVNNAVKVAPAGSAIGISGKRDAGCACFSVSDEGPGVEEDKIPHLFDRYWQGHRASGKGRGLGLAIVKGIVEGHGGRVGVVSRKGQGSTFFFRLPLDVADSAR